MHVEHVVPNTEPSGGKEQKGVVYALPRTVLEVKAKVTRKVAEPGIYWDWAKLFFYSESVVDGREADPSEFQRHVSFAVSDPEFRTFGEPDPQNVYHLRIKGGATLKQTAELELKESGAVAGVSTEVENQLSDVILAGVSSAFDIFGGFAFGRSGRTVGDANCGDAEPDGSDLRCYLEALELPELLENYQRIAEDDQRARKQQTPAADAQTPAAEAQTPAETGKQEPCQGSLKNKLDCRFLQCGGRERFDAALKVYRDIKQEMEETNAFRRGEVSQSPGVEFIVTQRRQMTNAKMSKFFAGKTIEKPWNGVFEFRPDKKNILKFNDKSVSIDLFEYSESTGICDADEGTPWRALLAGKEPSATFISKSCGASRDKKKVKIVLSTTDPNQFAAVFARNFKLPAEPGLRYVVPGAAIVKLNVGDQMLGRTTALFAQLGAEGAYPAKLGGKAVAQGLQFYESSGAVKKVTLTSRPLVTGDTVEGLGSDVSGLLDARREARDAAAADADELARLERARKILEEKTKILDYCSDLGITNCEIP